MAYKINGTTVVDNSRNVCACCVTSCCITASSRMDAPSGNTASRPGSPATGSLYFDTDLGSLISYNGSDWAAVGGSSEHSAPLTFWLSAGPRMPENYQCFYWTNSSWCGKSAIVPTPNGGWDAFQYVICNCPPYTNPNIKYFTNVTQSNPENGKSGFTGTYYSQGPTAGDTFCTLSMWPGFMLGHMEWGGMNPSSGVRNLYVTPTCFCNACNVANNCQCCYKCDRPLGYIDTDPDTGGPAVFMRKICICTNGCTFSGVKDPRQHVLRYDSRTISNSSTTERGYIGHGFHCCGFIVHGHGCHDCNQTARPSLCCGGIYVVGGFKHEYFTTTDLCAPHTCKCMTWDFRCLNSYNDWLDFIPHFNPDNKTVWAILRKNSGNPGHNYMSIYCIGNAASCGYACTQCWCLCAVPHFIRGGCCAYHDMLGNGCRAPRRSVYWCNQIWLTSAQQGQRFYSINCCNQYCTYCFCSHGIQRLDIMDLGVDYENNLRVFARCCCTCTAEFFEAIIPRVAADCPGKDQACCTKLFKWCLKGLLSMEGGSANRVAQIEAYKTGCGGLHCLSRQIRGLGFAEMENTSKRIAFNGIAFRCNSGSVCGARQLDSLLLDQIPYSCDANLCWYCGFSRLCITRCNCGALLCGGCNSSSKIHIATGSSRTTCTQQFTSTSCGCLPIHSNGGIGLCAGFDIVNPTGIIPGFCHTGNSIVSGGLGTPVASDTCYNVGY